MMPTGVKVFLASQPVDFRKGPDGLLALVRDGGSDPFSGALYVFRAKRKDRIKIVWWDGSGVCLYAQVSTDHAGLLFYPLQPFSLTSSTFCTYLATTFTDFQPPLRMIGRMSAPATTIS